MKSNIGDYGGDADKVTVFGQSAGSMAIRWDSHILHNYTKKLTLFSSSALIAMESATDFNRAILQSGTLARSFFLQGLEDDRKSKVEEFGDQVGCSADNDLVECLRGKSVTELVATSTMFPAHTVWQPIVDIALGEDGILPVDPLSR